MKPEVFQLFKSYDVRGTYPNINATVAYWVGYSLVKNILEKENLPLTVNIIHDHRLSSPELYKALYNGIKDAGGQPRPLGLGSTDMLYASTQYFNNAGVMITASHNPPADNGIKIVKKAPQMLGIGTGLEVIRDSEYFQNLKDIQMDQLDDVFEDKESKDKLLEFYKGKIREIGDVENIKESLSNKKLKVVVDTGNGIGGFVMPYIKSVYPEIEFLPLFWELDGNYPNHTADPIKDENIKDLQNSVKENNADFGIAFDGDADRAFFIDENGNRVIGDFLMAEFAKFMLKQYFSGKESLKEFNPAIVYNYPSSRCTPDMVLENNGKPIASMQGHNHMKANMLEYKAIYGGEHSGHHYYCEFGYMDSGVMTAALFIQIFIKKGIKASDLTDELRKKYLLSGERNFKLIDQIDTETRLKVIDQKLKQKYSDAEYNYLDGITVLYPDWKFNVRLSNTEPLLRLNLEVKNTDGNKNQDYVEGKVSEVKEILGLD